MKIQKQLLILSLIGSFIALTACTTINPPRVQPYLNRTFKLPYPMYLCSENLNPPSRRYHLSPRPCQEASDIICLGIVPKNFPFSIKKYIRNNVEGYEDLYIVLKAGPHKGKLIDLHNFEKIFPEICHKPE